MKISRVLLSKLAKNDYLRSCMIRISRIFLNVSYNSSYDFNQNGEVYSAHNYLSNENEIIDIGANNGDWIEFYLSIFPEAHCVLVEANPSLAEQLEERFRNNTNVRVINVAISSESGQADFHIPKQKDTHSSLEDVKVGREDDDIETISVKTMTGADLMSHIGWDKIGLLKIDVEGHELKVLSGFSEEIAEGKIRNIQFEYSEINLEKRLYLEDFYNLLPNYIIGRIYPAHIDFKDYSLEDENFIPGNFFATLDKMKS